MRMLNRSTRASTALAARRRCGDRRFGRALPWEAALAVLAALGLLASPAAAIGIDRGAAQEWNDDDDDGPRSARSAPARWAEMSTTSSGSASANERNGPWWVRGDDDAWSWLPPGWQKKLLALLDASSAAGGAVAASGAGAAVSGGAVPSGIEEPGGGDGAPIPEPSALLLFASGALLASRRIGFRSGAAEEKEPAAAAPFLRIVADEPSSGTAPAGRAVATRRLALATKRGIDIVGAALGLTLAAPILALAALAIRLDSRGSVFFRQVRCGLHGRPFAMWKLRTMFDDAPEQKSMLLDRNEMDGPVFKLWDDPRVTRVGRVLRRFSVDELPQLWNVLRGEMSLVGPRPPLEEEVVLYTDYQRRRLTVKPGLTCEWQVSGRNLIGFEDWVELDLDYIRRWSLRRDLALIARTLPAVVRGTGAA